MHAHTRSGQLLGDVPPPSAALQRELAIPIRAVPGQPHPQRRPRRRADLTPPHQPVAVHVIERDLLPVHVETAYHRHQWDLLELLKNFSDAQINERLSRGGPHHMSSF
jgi:hypothetical protein